jgi:undecaprenyl pyrophosphate phosphatase UppP
LSAVITSEYATQRTRGMMIAAVFAMQGVGQLAAAITAIVVIRAFKEAIMEDVMNVDYVWRICLGLGIDPFPVRQNNKNIFSKINLRDHVSHQ